MRRGPSSWCVLLLSFLGSLAWAQPPEDLETDDLEPNAHARDWHTLAAGGNHSLSVAEDGTVWAWGYSAVGDGTDLPRSRPVQVPQLSGIVSVAAGIGHSLALGADGRVWAWGDGQSGQLGLGDFVMRQLTPVLVPGLTNVVAITANGNHSLALGADGRVWGWGDNGSGQLGIAPWLGGWLVWSPLEVPGLSSANVKALSTGMQHTLALSGDGTVWAWGDNFQGQLGDGTLQGHPSPAPVPGLTHVVAVSAGWGHTLALDRQGTVWAWGSGQRGVLGIGPSAPEVQTTPVAVPGLTKVRALATSWASNLALGRDGTVWGWGVNSDFQLAQPSKEPQYVPVRVRGLRGVRAIAIHLFQGLAQRHDGSVWGWGNDFQAAVGTGATMRLLPVSLPGIQGVVTSSIGAYHVLALRQDGSVWSWGTDSYGQRGNSTAPPGEQPAPVEGLVDAVAVAAVKGSSLVARRDGSLWAWGNNAAGLLGDGTLVSRSTPQPVPGLTNIVAVLGGEANDHVLALSGDGRVWAWGQNAFGQLGEGTTTARLSPVLVPGLTDVVAIAAGAQFSLALRRDGQVWAWGRNDFQQLGEGTTTARLSPVLVPGLTDVVAINAGGYHVLALRSDGTLWGWGYNGRGQLDPALSQNRLGVPTPLSGMTQIAGVAAGSVHSLALRSDGSVWSWGSNSQGQLGRGAQSDEGARPMPAPIPGLSGVVSLSAGGWTSQAVLANGTARAWGRNSELLIGDGVPNMLPSPRLITPPRHPPHP